MTRLLVLALAAAAAAAPLPLAGQQDTTTTEFLCWRGRPLPHCSGFAVVEIQGGLSVASTTRQVRTPLSSRDERVFEHRLEWNLGLLKNFGPHWAVGGVVTIGEGAPGFVNAFRVRGRRWLNPPMSAELEVGVLASDMAERWGTRTLWGPSVGARLNAGDHASLFVRWDGVHTPVGVANADRGGYDAEADGGFQQGFYVGASVGHTWAAGVTALGAAFLWWVLRNCC